MKLLDKKIAAIVSSLLLVCLMISSAAASGFDKDKKKRKSAAPTVGKITVKTAPEAYPILINGQPYGNSGIDKPAEFDLAPGSYKVEILFPERVWTKDVVVEAGKSNCICLKINRQTVSRPCPFDVVMSAPDEVFAGDLVTFASVPNIIPNVENAPAPQLNYRWRVTPENARIVSGQGTSSITVDTTGLGNQTVRAELEIGDGVTDRECLQSVAAVTKVREIVVEPPAEFDEFDFHSFDDAKARLDNYVIALQQKPEYNAYLIVYGAYDRPAREADRTASQIIQYITQNRGLDVRRLTMINGGFRRRAGYELWLIPPGTTNLPTPSQTVPPKKRRK